MSNKNITTDSKALDYRIYVHNHFSKSNFDAWVIDRLQLKPNLHVLDIGCGSGKHLLTIANCVGEKGKVIGVDIDASSLKKCQEKIKEGGNKNATVVQADLTKLVEKIPLGNFDRALSSFAIYYTKNPTKTFADTHALLKPGGTLFMCGPTEKNNLEFLELVREAGGTFSKDFGHWSKFLADAAQGILKKIFLKVKVEYFNNPIEFPNAEVLYKYWTSTPLYNKTIERRMKKLIAKKFAQGKTFTSNKIIIGITCKK